jgi:hypothetical protein
MAAVVVTALVVDMTMAGATGCSTSLFRAREAQPSTEHETRVLPRFRPSEEVKDLRSTRFVLLGEIVQWECSASRCGDLAGFMEV